MNLLSDHIADVLLDAAAMGVNYVEREGISVSHAASFILVGTMNPEEGELRPQLLDRFGLAVEVQAERERRCGRRWCGGGLLLIRTRQRLWRGGETEQAERQRLVAARRLLSQGPAG